MTASHAATRRPTTERPTTERKVTGRTVLIWLGGFFFVMLVANIFFVYFALSSFPGVVTDRAYEAGQAYNRDIAASRAQSELNWNVSGNVTRGDDGIARIEVSALDAAGNPLTGLSVEATLQRPASPEPARQLVLSEGELGRYAAQAEDVAPGRWILQLDASSGSEGETFRSQNRVFFSE
jgi:nitrogen fixation protein FixH